MYKLIDIGERAGSGIPNIYDVWKKQKWNAPVLTEAFEPERIELVLPINIIEKVTIKSDDKKVTINSKKNAEQKNMIVIFIKEQGSVKNRELCDLLGVKSSRVKQLLRELIDEDILVAIGGNRNRTYSLKV